MSERTAPLYYYYSWEHVPDAMLPNIFAEFRDNGANKLVMSHIWLTRILREPQFFSQLMTAMRQCGVTTGAAHGVLGAAYDLNCSDMARRKGMLADQKLAMAYAADAGCRTYTIHVGAYSWVFEHVPLERLRDLAYDALTELVPEAEKLGIILAVENSFEPPNAPCEVVALTRDFSSKYLGYCFDTGHANYMSPFPGKDRVRFQECQKLAWFNGVVETDNALEQMRDRIVTCHMHDNDGYGDQHNLPGKGRIDWAKQVAGLKSCPEMIEFQTEVRMVPGTVSVKKLIETFNSIL